MTAYYNNTENGFVNNKVPIVKQLNAIFEAIPDSDLLSELQAPTGRPGYTPRVLWRTYVASFVLGLPTFASLIRALQNNPLLCVACGITSYEGIPSKFAYSRFMDKISQTKYRVMVKNIMRELTRRLYKELPDFGKSVAIDSTDLKAWSNGAKKRGSDRDASWGAKLDTASKKKFYFGYKLHLLADTQYELPIAANVTNASIHDSRVASRVFSNARYTYSKFGPQYVIADAGYSSQKLRRLIKNQYRAEPIIKVNPSHKKALFPETEEWKRIYDRRTSIERIFARLKGYRRLNNINVRRLRKVTVHCFLSLVVVQAQALHSAVTNHTSNIRRCVHAAT